MSTKQWLSGSDELQEQLGAQQWYINHLTVKKNLSTAVELNKKQCASEILIS